MIKKQNGFTLIEVLIALAIISIALTALLMTTADSIQGTTRLRDKILAHFVTSNALKEIQLDLVSLQTGQSITQSVEIFHQTWFWRATATPTDLDTVDEIRITASRHKDGPFSEPMTGFRRPS